MDKQYILGSGELYVTEFTGEIPEDTEIEKEANRYGHVSGGATLSYKPTYYAVNDDLGRVKDQILTAEEVTFKSGLMHKSFNFVPKVCPTAKQTDQEGTSVTEIGGIDNADEKQYIVHFVGASKAKGIKVTIVGICTSGFEAAFAKDKETLIDSEFAAVPYDEKGHLIKITEKKEGV